MKIEKGKFYKTRDGRKVEILKTDVKNPQSIIGMITRSDGHEFCASWYDNGMYFKGAEDNIDDIIGEWKEALDFDPHCLPKWSNQWIAMDADGEWYSYSTKPTLDEEYKIWSSELELSEIPERFHPKNYNGHWKDSLFNVEQLKKDNKRSKYDTRNT